MVNTEDPLGELSPEAYAKLAPHEKAARTRQANEAEDAAGDVDVLVGDDSAPDDDADDFVNDDTADDDSGDFEDAEQARAAHPGFAPDPDDDDDTVPADDDNLPADASKWITNDHLGRPRKASK